MLGMGEGEGQRAKYLLPCCCIRYSITFEIQHDHVLKKLNFDLLTPMVGVGGSAGTIFATMLVYSLFPLI